MSIQQQESHSPLTVGNIIAATPATHQPQTYLMSHLLAAGFRGTEYQLLILMLKLSSMLVQQQAFTAVVEIKDHGNLDDIGIVLSNGDNQVTTVTSYQVKYYNHDISVYDFFNQTTDDTKANETMHIGKFFAGWLAWKAKHPDLADNKIASIVYTNADVDAALKKCLHGEVFTTEFINHRRIITIPLDPRVHANVPKNFLTKITTATVSSHYSTKTWIALNAKGFIDHHGNFTDRFTPDDPTFSLGLTKSQLPKGVDNTAVLAALKQIYRAYQQNLVDIWVLLYEQAWAYIVGDATHKPLANQTDADKKALFRQFLRSFRFQLQQDNLLACEARILNDLKILSPNAPQQVFLCLYYAIREWFRSEEHSGNVPVLTNQIVSELIAVAKTNSHDLHVLRGISQATILQIPAFFAERIVPRVEKFELEQALTSKEFVFVAGKKGVGKSGLVQTVLMNHQHIHPAQYLVFAAANLTHNPKLRKQLIEVLTRIAAVNILVIDGAEALLEMQEPTLKKFMAELKQTQCTIIFTLVPEALSHDCFNVVNRLIILERLAPQDVLTTFPELTAYAAIDQLMQLATMPFNLVYIMRLINQMGTAQFNHLVTTRNHALEGDLVKLVIEGPNSELSATRRLNWQRLAIKMAVTPQGLTQGVTNFEVTAGLQLLIDEHMVQVEQHHDQLYYRFQHDLLFEHALMTFLIQKWEIAAAEEDTARFWPMLTKYLATPSATLAFEKWLSCYWLQIQDDVLAQINLIALEPYVHIIISNLIINQQNNVLTTLLTIAQLDLNTIFKHAAHSAATYLLLAIWYNNATAITILSTNGAAIHNPAAGRLTLASQTAYYNHQPQLPSTNDTESDASDTESSGEQDFFQYDEDESDSEDRQQQDIYSTESTDPSSEIIEQFVNRLTKYWPGFDEDEAVDSEEDELFVPIIIHQMTKPTYNHYYLHQAAIYDRSDCLDTLSTLYAQHDGHQVINLQTEFQETALHVAVLNNSHAAIRMLLAKGAAVDLSDHWGETPLHNAAYQGDVISAELLLRYRAAPNALNKYGLSPLHVAIARLDIDMVELLLRYGADLSLEPFSDVAAGMVVADLLQEVWEQCHTADEKEELENFVIALVTLLNYGEDDNEFIWATNCLQHDPHLRQQQLAQVDELMTLIEHRAKLSEFHPGFDYYDDETMLEYAVDHGDFETLEQLTEYILSDPDNIACVLESDAFRHLREELVDQWLENADATQYQHMKEYAEEYDEELLERINADLALLSDSEDSPPSNQVPVSLLAQSLASSLNLGVGGTQTDVATSTTSVNAGPKK